MNSLLNAAFFDDDALRAYLPGTYRCRSPQQTWDLIHPLLADAGITRLANVTGLDRLGIPVYMAVRPNSRSLSVSQGKGIDKISAKVSAAMESLELYHGEKLNSRVRMESYHRLEREVCVINPDSLPLRRNSLYNAMTIIPWVEGIDIVNSCQCWVPYELVHTNATIPRVPGSGCFLSTTNGLASGNTLSEAVLHGLLEVVERDAHALWSQLTDEKKQKTRIDLRTVDSFNLELIKRFTTKQVSVMAWDMSTDTEISVVSVTICDNTSDPLIKPYPASYGAGCHPDRVVALSRALTEAAQSRLTTISGSRDDMTRARYHLVQHEDSLNYYKALANVQGTKNFSLLRQSSFEMPGRTIEYVQNNLSKVGINNIVVIDLSITGLPINVARVIVPGLEGAIESAYYVPGLRAKRRSL